MRHILCILFVIFILIPAPGLRAQTEPEHLTRVTLIPHWIPQAQFAGYYVAYEKGFYRQRGIEVNILRGGPDKPSAELLAQGAADFGTMFLSTGIQERARGTPLVHIGQIVQRSSLLLVARKSSGIHTPQDMNGRKVGLWGAELRIQPAAFFRKHGLQVHIVPQSFTVNLFLRGGVDVASAMTYNEYHLLLNAGLDPEELSIFPLADYGMNFPEDGIYCLESTLRRDPEMSCRFVRASLEGWRYAAEHPEEALDIVMKYVREGNTATNRVHQKWMLERMLEGIQPLRPGTPMGTLLEADYATVAHELASGGLIDHIPSFSDFFRDCIHEK